MISLTRSALVTAAIALAAAPSSAQVFSVSADPVDFDRWMYPFNGTPGTRGFASTFGAVDSATEFDNKDAQVIIGVDTVAAGIPAGLGPSAYGYVKITLYMTHFLGVFEYDPTYDSWRTYLDPLDPSYVADSDTGRPIELYGTGYRNGYLPPLQLGLGMPGPVDFEEGEAFCAGCVLDGGQALRNVFALDFGLPDPENDASNNVVRTAPLSGTGFETDPWAIGISTSGLSPGDTVPEGVFGTTPGETFAFEIDTFDPDVLAYVQEGLHEGVLEFVVVSMHDTVQMAGGTNPNFHTSETPDSAGLPPAMDILVAVPEPGAAAGLVPGVIVLTALAHRRFTLQRRARPTD